jgi:hypothetical protein
VAVVYLLLARPDPGLTQQAGVDSTPADGRAWIDTARNWRAEGEPDSALAALRRAAEFGDVPPGLISLELARTAFLAGYPSDGLEAYRDGCGQADAETLGEYWRDFAAVATIDEQTAWHAAMELGASARTDAACALLEAGWGQRAARAGLGVAERLSLHYERLRYARERYALMRDGTRLGPRTRLLSNQVGRPEGADLDDRGLVYVRLGEPDRIASFGGSGAVTRRLPHVRPDDGANAEAVRVVIRDLQISAECYHPNESWAYDFPSGTRTFHFSPLEGAADWWLLENLFDVYRCGDPTNVVSMSGDLSEAMTAVLTPAAGTRHAPPAQIAWLVMTDLYMSRVGMDPSYGPIAHRIHASGPNDVEELDGLRITNLQVTGVLSGFSEERQISFEAARSVLAEIPDRPAVTPDAPFAYELLQFRAEPAADGRTRVWLNAVMQAEPLQAAPAEDGGVRYDVHATISLAGEHGDLYQREAVFSLRTARELGDGAGIPARLAVEAPPGRYVASVVLRDANDEGERPVGNWETRDLTVRSYAPSVPLLSDVAVAPDSGGAAEIAPGVALPISPVHETDANRRAWVYFEAYGLSPQGDYQVEVRLEPKGDGEPFTLSYRGSPPPTSHAAMRRLLRLELDDSPPGEYTLRLTVTDGAGRQSLPLETSLRVR